MQILEAFPFVGLVVMALIRWLRHPDLWHGDFS